MLLINFKWSRKKKLFFYSKAFQFTSHLVRVLLFKNKFLQYTQDVKILIQNLQIWISLCTVHKKIKKTNTLKNHRVKADLLLFCLNLLKWLLYQGNLVIYKIKSIRVKIKSGIWNLTQFWLVQLTLSKLKMRMIART